MSTEKNSHQNQQPESNNETSDNLKKYVRKKRYPYKLYIAENLDIQEILESDKPDFKYYTDYFIYILHLIVSIPSRLKDYDFEKQKGFTPIHKSILSRRIHNYREYIHFLLKHDIIEEGTQYLPGHYSKGLKYSEKYRVKVKGIYITKNTLIKSITENHNYRDLLAEKKLKFLSKWFNSKLTIDMEKVIEFLELDKEKTRKKLEKKRAKIRIKKHHLSIDEIVTMGYNMKFIVADRINEGKNFHPIVDNTSGRFHSPLTQLKKELRPFLRYDGERLYSLDIVNSQPVLALIVIDYNLFMKNKIYKMLSHYNENHSELKDMNKLTIFNNPSSTMLVNLLKQSHKKKDVQLYRKAVIEGKFYEFFGDLLLQKDLLPNEIRNSPEQIRKFAKHAIFTAFFSRIKDARWNPHIQAFKRCFPTVARIFDLIKAGTDNHEALACILQRFESQLVLHDTCRHLQEQEPEMPIFTIHDSIITTEKWVNYAESIFRIKLFKKLNASPQLQIEVW